VKARSPDPGPGSRESHTRHETLKRCTCCKREKPLEEFPPNPRYRDGHSSHCRRCNNEAVRRWRERNRDKVEAYNAARREEYRRRRAA
jgi:hypothetical protein